MKYILLFCLFLNTSFAGDILLPPPPPSLSGDIRDIMKPRNIAPPAIKQNIENESKGWIIRENKKNYELLVDDEWRKAGDTFDGQTIVSISDKLLVLKDSDGEKKIPLVIELNYKKRN